MTEEVQLWVDRATEDLASIRVLLAAGIWAQACFHAQQCVEKLLKAALLSQGMLPPRRHYLIELLDLLDPALQTKLSAFRASLATLDDYYMPTRYADALLGSASGILPDADDATKALAVVEQVSDIVIATLSEP